MATQVRDDQEPNEIRKWAGRRRAAGIIGAVSLAFFGTTMAELDKPIYVVDDIVAGVIGLIVLLLYLVYRNKTSIGDMRKQANIFTTLLVVAYAVKFAWLFVELNDPDAMGDDVAAIFFLLAVILNRVM
jgi:heme/copper-type cytochrome/quinol oxidase subunit 4